MKIEGGGSTARVARGFSCSIFWLILTHQGCIMFSRLKG